MHSLHSHTRNQQGSVAALLPLAILLAVVAIGAFAVDVSHNVTVRSELQNATDAAALAGATEMLKPETENNADFSALQVAEANEADGKPVSNSTAGRQITVQPGSWDTGTNSATFDADAEATINNVFARIFGHPTDTLTTHSRAQVWRSIVGIPPNYGFPLIVSIDTTNGNPQPLWKLKVGDNFDIHINSQKFKNGAWTSFKMKNTNANWLKDAMDMSLGFMPMKAGHFTGIEVGEDASMANGVMAQKELAKGEKLAAITEEGRSFVIPVMTGDPPYNQSRKVVGFITIRVRDVTINKSGGQVETLHATLVKGLTKGEGGLPRSSGDPAIDKGISELSPGVVRLVQ
jgi:Flp pilus assembly protein TadG